jgi:hypothetical protein
MKRTSAPYDVLLVQKDGVSQVYASYFSNIGASPKAPPRPAPLTTERPSAIG